MVLPYSIIIPHKNIPDLLQRCLDSIPKRDDIQIIIVDDNSNPSVVDFDHFPGIHRRNTKVIFTKENRGAGFARNVGLTYATGKWLIFADADDFFTTEFSLLLDEMVDIEEDLVFFNHRSVLSSDPSIPAVRTQYLSEYIYDYLHGNSSELNLRCRCPIPTCKFIRRSIVEENRIRFSETHWGNDIYFSAQVSSFARKIRVSERIGYVMTVRDGSLISDFCGSRDEVLDRLQETLKAERCLARHNYRNKSKLSNSYLWIAYHKHGFRWCLKTCMSFITHPRAFFAFLRFLFKRFLTKIGRRKRTGVRFF